jgi:hypothetical protein
MHDLYTGFKKVAEDEKRAVLEHEQGHSLNIAKSGLSRKHLKNLAKLPLYQAKGTQPDLVEQEQQPEIENELKTVGATIADKVAEKIVQGATEAISSEQIAAMPDVNATDVQTGEPVAKEAGASEPVEPQRMSLSKTGPNAAQRLSFDQYQQFPEQQASSLQPQEEVVPTQTEEIVSEQAIPTTVEQTTQAPTQVAQPKQQRGPTQLWPMLDEEVIASARTTPSQKMMAYNNMVLKTMQERKALREKFEKNIRDKQIEPKKMYGDDTIKNIVTAISLLMGGMAGGILKTENPALKMINEEIEKDLDRQKANIGIEQNLYKYNLDMLNDDISAYTQSMNQMRHIALTKMEEMMGKVYDPSNPMAALQIQAEAAKLRAEIDKSDAQVAAREQREKILSALANTQGVSNMDPSGVAQILVTEDADRAKVYEEIKDRQTIAQTMPDIFRLFDKAKVENTALRTGTVPYLGRFFKKPDSVAALETLFTPLIKTQGPAREAEMQRIFQSVIPGPYDSDTDHETKRQALKEYIKAVSQTPVSNAYQLNLNKFKSTSFQDPNDSEKMQFLDYANKNINSSDPAKKARSQKILQMYGQ